MSTEAAKKPATTGTIEVCHMARSDRFDHYGGRANGGDDELRHLNNTEPDVRGWLGNPYEMREGSVDERRRVIAAYLEDFLDRVESDQEFREAVEGLRGQQIACWCRGASQDRQPSNWCHLDVVKCWLEDDLGPVYEYLQQ